MEKKKNNALEKAEQVQKNVSEQNKHYSEIVKPKNNSENNNTIKIGGNPEDKKTNSYISDIENNSDNMTGYNLKLKKQELKNQRKKEKYLLKKQKLEAKNQMALNRQKFNQKNHGKSGYVIAVIALSVISLALASVLTFTYLMPSESQNDLESQYKKSFYNAVEQVSNMDVNMSKALATSEKGAMQLYLTDIAINSELAENDLSVLPLKDENKYYTMKLINQIGDYAKYLNRKIVMGESLSDEDYDALLILYYNNRTLNDALNQMLEGMGEDYSFSDMDSEDIVLTGFNELENLSVSYPELIYDGPFSDGADRVEIKNLNYEEITEEVAKGKFNEIFGEYNLKNVNVEGSLNSLIECYNITGEKDGEQLYAQLSKKGGKLIAFAYSGSCREIKYDESSAIESALRFLTKQNIVDMKAVWSNLSNNVYTINFAYEQDGIIIYPDMIKVRVCAETGTVIGLEGTSYYTNHTVREIGNAELSEEQASEKISENIEVESVRLVISPYGERSEKLCYEFYGKYNESDYFIYIDAVNGRQIEMFKVIDSRQGKLLI